MGGFTSAWLKTLPTIERGGDSRGELWVQCIKLDKPVGEQLIARTIGTMKSAEVATHKRTQQCMYAIRILQRKCGVAL